MFIEGTPKAVKVIVGAFIAAGALVAITVIGSL